GRPVVREYGSRIDDDRLELAAAFEASEEDIGRSTLFGGIEKAAAVRGPDRVLVGRRFRGKSWRCVAQEIVDPEIGGSAARVVDVDNRASPIGGQPRFAVPLLRPSRSCRTAATIEPYHLKGV